MIQKAIFLDRDGTINVEKDYLYRIEDFELINGVEEALRRAQAAGYKLIIITNQSGIARGYYTEEDFNTLTDWMTKAFQSKGIIIDRVYFCPHHPEAKIKKYRVKCNCRKPGLGLFRQAISDFNLSIDKCYTIGDKIRDCAICGSTECKGFLIGNNEKQKIIDDVKNGIYKNVRYASNLEESVNIILSKGTCEEECR